MRVLVVALFLMMVGLTAAPALAQPPREKAEPDRVVIPSKTIIDLTGQVIEGAVEGPQAGVIFVPVRPQFGPMVQVRQSFHGELLSSANDL